MVFCDFFFIFLCFRDHFWLAYSMFFSIILEHNCHKPRTFFLDDETIAIFYSVNILSWDSSSLILQIHLTNNVLLLPTLITFFSLTAQDALLNSKTLLRMSNRIWLLGESWWKTLWFSREILKTCGHVFFFSPLSYWNRRSFVMIRCQARYELRWYAFENWNGCRQTQGKRFGK